MHISLLKQSLLICICVVSFSFLSVEKAEAGWFGDHVCCNSGSAIGSGDGRAGANNQVGGSSSGGSTSGIGSYIANVSTSPIPSNAHYTGQQTVNGVTYDVWSYAGSGTNYGPNLVSRPVSNGGNGNGGGGPFTGGGSSPKPATGYFDAVTPSNCSVYGWAYDPDNTAQAISVHIYKDNRAGQGTFVTACTADQARSDVNIKAHVPGNHGFTCVLPDSYRGTGDHALFIHAIDINGTPNALLQTNGKVMGCTPPPVPDVSVQNFVITHACSIDEMTASIVCPKTDLSFTIQNTGNKAISSGISVPYRVEYHLPADAATSPWRLAKTGSYTSGVDINGQSSTITQSVVNLPVGRSAVRVVVNPAPYAVALAETNVSNNISNSVPLTYVPGNTDLSFQSFAVTSACDTGLMAGNTPCPATKVTLALLNKGNKNVLVGMNVPYRVEYKDASGVWKTAVQDVYGGSIPAKSASGAGVSKSIIAVIPNLKMGATELRAIVNPVPRISSLNEVNFTDNVSTVITQTYAYAVGTVELIHKNEVVRYGATTTLDWSIDADYTFMCKLQGTFAPGVGQVLTNTPGIKSVGVVRTAGLTSTQNFSLSCTPKAGPGVPSDVVTRAVTIEVVPSVQEI